MHKAMQPNQKKGHQNFDQWQILLQENIYSNNIEATKITSDWYLWMHHTIDKIPDSHDNKYSWQKNHLENQTGTSNSFKPVKIKKGDLKKKYETWK